MELILASASPRRKELLGELIKNFEIIPSQGEEIVEGSPTPCELVKALARQKAWEVAKKFGQGKKAVLGSDTVVALGDEVLGKPTDEAHAFQMLSVLSGRAHEVYTGVCLLVPDKKGGYMEKTEADCTKVFFNRLTKSQIEAYIKTGSPMDKAGAYGIQDGGLVERIEGSFSNVVGLPVELCKRMFAESELVPGRQV